MTGSDASQAEAHEDLIPEAVVESKSRFSIVWLIPVVAILIGAWLTYKTLSEAGPTITIAFKTGEGIAAGKTKIKHKDVEIGTVKSAILAEDLSGVLVSAELVKGSEPYLTDKSHFWVVRARIAAGQVSGLGTLVSGAYIAMEPSAEGSATHDFVGLARPPVVTITEPGRRFHLRSETLGSLDIGVPVYFRRVEVGSVLDHRLEEDGNIAIELFVHAPHDKLVTSSTRFWNASGVDFTITSEGATLDTQSLLSVLIGGVAFDEVAIAGQPEPVGDSHVFTLHPNRATAEAKPVTEKTLALVLFDGSIRGLEVGAPVEVRGIAIGKVLDIRLQYDPAELSVRIPVLIEIEQGRFEQVGSLREGAPADNVVEELRLLVNKGLRAQLKTASLLTGKLFVELDFHPNAQAARLGEEGRYPVLPSIPSAVAELRGGLLSVVRKLESLPLQEISQGLNDALRGAAELTNSEELRQAIASLDTTLANTSVLSTRVNELTVPVLDATLKQATATLRSAQGVLREDSPLYHELKRTLEELSSAARSIRLMADYLERHPEALIQGKHSR